MGKQANDEFKPLPIYNPDGAVRVPLKEELRHKEVTAFLARWLFCRGLPRREVPGFLIDETSSFQLEGGGVYAFPDGTVWQIDDLVVDVVFGRRMSPKEMRLLLDHHGKGSTWQPDLDSDYRWFDDLREFARRRPGQRPQAKVLTRYQVMWCAIASSTPGRIISEKMGYDNYFTD